MKSKDAIFFDKNVETSVAIVPRVLRLLLPARIKMKIRVPVIGKRIKIQNNLQSLDYQDSRFYDVWMMAITLSLLAGRRAAQHAGEVEGWEEASLCF